jgi:uroporphyrinogen decarboxylase
VDPVQGGDDLATVKAELSSRVAVLGGVNSAITLGRGTKEEIRAAVNHAVEVMAPGGGFILSPVDCLFPDTPWESVATLIDAWREVCEY